MKAWDSLAAAFGIRRLLLGIVATFVAVLALGAGLAAATAPVVTVENASNVGANSADVEGHVNPEGQSTSWRFQYATEADFSNAQDGPSGSTEVSEDVSGQLNGLQPGTTYHLRLLAENADGQSEAVAASTFTTKSTPVVSLESESGQYVFPEFSAYEVRGTEATLRGLVNPENSEVSDCHFVYGIGTASGNTIPCDPPHPALNETQEISVNATSGQFKLSFESETTGYLAFNASATQVQAALEGLASIGPGNVEVSGGPGGPGGAKPYVIVFIEDLSGQDLPQIVAEDGTSPLAGEVEVRTTEQGGGGFDEKQRITVHATGGQYRLSFESETTPDLMYYAGAGEVQAALEGLASIGPGNVLVQEHYEQLDGYYGSYDLVTFSGALAGQNLPQITATSGSEPLKGSVTVGTRNNGSLVARVPVSAHLTGLAPETEYRYKLVATNAAGTEETAEQSFRTLALPPAEGACANEARRQEQHMFPPECRAYEMVSPNDKNNNPVIGEGTNIPASTDGNRAFFASRGGFADTTGSAVFGFTYYLSHRSAAGWQTQSVTPTPSGAAFQVFNSPTGFGLFDESLQHATLWALDLPARSDDFPDDENVYRMNLENKSLETITNPATAEGPIAYFDHQQRIGETWGASADLGVLTFPSETKLLPNPEIPEANAEGGHGTPNTYEWDHGTLRLAGILPDGHVPAGGSTPPPGGFKVAYRGTVSRDGSRALFVAPSFGNQQLYMRRNHSNTVWISEPESSGFSGEPEGVQVQWVSPDAHKILFTTTSNLVNEDTDGEADLYLYTDGPNPSAETNLELITHGNETPSDWADMNTVLGASDDASRIYYRITAGPLIFWEAGHARPIFDAGPGPETGPQNSPGSSRVTPDGRFLAFYRQDAVNGRFVGTMHVFDADRNTLTCASCAQHGPTTGSVPDQPQVNTGGGASLSQLRPRFLSANGEKVFFSTTSALVPQDTNGVMDVYEYNTATGQQQLLSSGKGDQGEWFVNASASGNDVFFITNGSLIGRDGDALADLYDARVEGGFPEPPPPPAQCSGDGCRDPLSSGQGGPSPATASFSGPGNPHHHKKARKHRKRHHKKHHHGRHHHHKKGAGR